MSAHFMYVWMTVCGLKDAHLCKVKILVHLFVCVGMACNFCEVSQGAHQTAGTLKIFQKFV